MCGIAACYQQADGQKPVRAVPLRRLIQDEQADREDPAKQVWQLLTLELWYRNMRSIGMAI